tara:strand:- start:3828 stop:4487 length:660 start_codon:yes stop_codon:yes gene_type:complete
MNILRFTIFTVGFLFGITAHGTGPQLFKDYNQGSMYEDYAGVATFYDCSAEVGTPALCNDGVNFLSSEFTEVLVFQDNELQSVSLVSEFSEPLYQKVFAALYGKFSLSLLQSSTDQLDLIKLKLESKNESEFMAQLTEFESIALNQGDLTYVFFDTERRSSGQVANITELIHKLPEKAREIDLLIAEDEYDAWLTMKFTLPVLQVKNIEKLLRQPMEDF